MAMETKDVIIQLPSGDRLISTSPNQSILQSALEAGIKLIHSCMKGQCGSCRAYLVDGKVDMKNNFSLFEEEVNEGQILLCQSYPVTNEVIVKPIRKPKAI